MRLRLLERASEAAGVEVKLLTGDVAAALDELAARESLRRNGFD